MKRSWRVGLGIVGMLAVLAVADVSAARADVGFSGTFRGPHGQFSIHVGSPAYPVGSYVPYGYRVYQRPRHGYGFDTPAFSCRSHGIRHAHWVPVRSYQRRWLVVERPILAVEQPYYGRDGYDDRRYTDERYSDRRYDDRRYKDRRNDDQRYNDRRYNDRRYDNRHRDERGWRDDYGRKGKRHKHSRDRNH